MRAPASLLLLLPAAGAFVARPHGLATPALRQQHCCRPRSSAATRMQSNIGEDIERALLAKFGREKAGRVIDSFHRTRVGDPFEKEWEDKGLQQAASYMEGLFADAWHDPTQYPWAAKLEQQWEVIAEELQAVMSKKGVEKKGTNVWAAAARDDALAYGPDWRTLVLQDRAWDPVNMKLFPKTTAIVKESGVPSCEVFFAKQAPKTGIKPHTDDTNFILTAHLGLEVPEGECSMTVGNETREWRNGKALIFDTSFVHSTANDSERTRTVLLIRFFHPEVTADEQAALRFIFDAIEDPSIIAEAALVAAVPASSTEGMTRQERREMERAAKKAAKRGRA